MPDPIGIPSLAAYVDSLQGEAHADYAIMPASRVAHEDAFAEMKNHIVSLYEGVEAQHSFVDESGSIFDCIPVEQQPALRGSSESVPTAPTSRRWRADRASPTPGDHERLFRKGPSRGGPPATGR